MSVDEVNALRTQLATALRELEEAIKKPCPGCVCADTEHRYCPICADAIQDIQAERDRLRTALDDAASSLAWIADRKLHNDPLPDVYWEIRGYAESRAKEARAALGGSNG